MLGILYPLALRTVATRGRVIGLLVLGLVGVLVGASIGLADDPDRLRSGVDLMNTFGLSLYAPVTALVFASGALGDLQEDGTLVYLWARPVPRWQIVLAAWLAAMTVAVPLTMGPLVLAAVATGGGSELVVGTAVSTIVAVLSYGSLFCFLGLRIKRALVWGLVYLLLWENFIASAGPNAARLALRSYTRSLLSEATDIRLRLADRSTAASVVVPLVVSVLAIWLTVRRLHRQEVA